MTFDELAIQSGTISFVVVLVSALCVFFLRKSIGSWIDSRIRFASEKEMEVFRSELANISAVRDSVLSGKVGRQALLDERRLDSIDLLWKSVRHFDRYMSLPKALQVLKLDAVFETIEYDQRLQGFFGVVTSSFSEEVSFKEDIIFHDHYIPKQILNLYSSYISIITMSHCIANCCAKGINPRKLLKNDTINEDIGKAVPSLKKFIEERGEYSWIFCDEIVRSKLKYELYNFVHQTQSETKTLEDFAHERCDLPAPLDSKTLQAINNLPREIKK